MALVNQPHKKSLQDAGVSEDTRVRDLTEEELGRIRQEVNKYTIRRGPSS